MGLAEVGADPAERGPAVVLHGPAHRGLHDRTEVAGRSRLARPVRRPRLAAVEDLEEDEPVAGRLQRGRGAAPPHPVDGLAGLPEPGRQPGEVAVAGDQGEGVEVPRVEKVHRVDDERRVGRVLAHRVGELLDRLDRVARQLRLPAGELLRRPVAVRTLDRRRAVPCQLGEHGLRVGAGDVVGIDEDGESSGGLWHTPLLPQQVVGGHAPGRVSLIRVLSQCPECHSRVVPTELSLARHLDGLRSAMVAFVRYADRAGPEAPVPTCPDWTVRDLVVHQGMVHRWAAALVHGENGVDADAFEAEGRGVPDPLEWLRDGVIELAETLTRAPEDTEALVFLDDAPRPREFWARRQCHETTVHAVDALSAALGRHPAGSETWIETDVAVDGIDELLGGFLTRPRSRLR